MTTTLSQEQVLALAPDAAAAKAGRGQAKARIWQNLGGDGRALWGDCQGSAKEPYRVQIDLQDLASRCSCPSRKFPCKHSLGLLLLFAEEPELFQAAAPPARVSEWIAGRDERAARQAAPPPTGTDVVTEERRASSRAKRAASRESKVAAGVETCAVWLRDMLREGLATAPNLPQSHWETAAARMVDAQAPGLARMIREMGGIPFSGAGWQDRLLAAMSRLHLLLEAYRRIDSLNAEQQADVRSAIGFTVNREDVLALPGQADHWLILGRTLEKEGNLQVQRSWLWGARSSRPALLLDFSAANQPLDRSLAPGTVLEGQLHFYPGTAPLRALPGEYRLINWPTELPPGQSIATALAGAAAMLAGNPWLERFLCWFENVTLLPGDSHWQLRDAGHSLPLVAGFQSGWQVLALSAGQPLRLAAEWDGRALRPLSMHCAEGFFQL